MIKASLLEVSPLHSSLLSSPSPIQQEAVWSSVNYIKYITRAKGKSLCSIAGDGCRKIVKPQAYYCSQLLTLVLLRHVTFGAQSLSSLDTTLTNVHQDDHATGVPRHLAFLLGRLA